MFSTIYHLLVIFIIVNSNCRIRRVEVRFYRVHGNTTRVTYSTSEYPTLGKLYQQYKIKELFNRPFSYSSSYSGTKHTLKFK